MLSAKRFTQKGRLMWVHILLPHTKDTTLAKVMSCSPCQCSERAKLSNRTLYALLDKAYETWHIAGVQSNREPSYKGHSNI